MKKIDICLVLLLIFSFLLIGCTPDTGNQESSVQNLPTSISEEKRCETESTKENVVMDSQQNTTENITEVTKEIIVSTEKMTVSELLPVLVETENYTETGMPVIDDYVVEVSGDIAVGGN